MIRQEFRLGPKGLLNDYLFVDAGGDAIGVTATPWNDPTCKCNIKAHFSIASRGVWIPDTAHDALQLADLIRNLVDGRVPDLG